MITHIRTTDPKIDVDCKKDNGEEDIVPVIPMHDGKYVNEKFLYADLNMTDKNHPNMIEMKLNRTEIDKSN